MEPERPSVSVGALIRNEKGEVLLGLRKGNLGNGEWSLPAGHIEFGETIFQAAVREVKEETDLNVTAAELISVADEMYDEKHYIGFGVATTYHGGEPKLMEPQRCSEWRWFNLDALPQNLFSATKAVLEHYRTKCVYSPSPL